MSPDESTLDTLPARLPAKPPTVAALEAERDFLLRSIADLDAERAAGELADDLHSDLRDSYTVQAAAVLRALRQLESSYDGETASDQATPTRSRRVVTVAAVVPLLIAVGGVLLGRSLDTRQPGETLTGNAQSDVGTDMGLDDLASAARQRPDDPDAQLAYAFALLEQGNAVDALQAFDAAARLDPSNAEPQAYAGWLVSLAGLTDDALARLDAAVATDPDYADAHFFRGMTLLRGRGDTPGALAELREYVRLAPPGPERAEVEAVIAELEQRPETTTTDASP
ncbi:MAG: tetratricopeptide repeat protein [Acidimicrobiia bacterium]